MNETLLHQTVSTPLANVSLTIQKKDTQLLATASVDELVIEQWQKKIINDPPNKNELQSFKKTLIELIKRDEHFIRKIKLHLIKQKSSNPFPNQVNRSHMCSELSALYNASRTDNQNIAVALCGRLISKRVMGKAAFSELKDTSGTIQIYCSMTELGERYQSFKFLDTGDIVQVSGFLFETEKHELTVHVQNIELLTKSLRPLPQKFHGLKDLELRYRQRYLDLISNPEIKKVFETRGRIIKYLRQFFDNYSFVEVETPMMHPIPGGASAEPFVTHHKALNMPLYLRIAPELYLKRLIVGGFERVYEINRNFRNEGLSSRHNPEFTMIEFYQAYADYHHLINLTEELFRYLAEQLGINELHHQGHIINLEKFEKMTLKESILANHSKVTTDDLSTIERCKKVAENLAVELPTENSLGHYLAAIFEQTVERKLIQPTFITSYPIEVSPLARKNNDDPNFADRFELFIAGQEIANGYSELNDPEEQLLRFKQQVKYRMTGDNEAMYLDKDYVRALEYGMPPTAGEGIGIDRLVMLLTDSASIRDVLLFPLMKPEA